MSFWQCFYHIVWATQERKWLLTDEMEHIVYGLIGEKAKRLGAEVFAVNGDRDHAHLVTAIPPKIAVATFTGQVKGVSSGEYNKLAPEGQHLYWQAEYAVFTFSKLYLERVVAYVKNQKQHHHDGTVLPLLERVGMNDTRFVREPGPVYTVGDEDWLDTLG
jgi:REP element-mobilizing transposase RayT